MNTEEYPVHSACCEFLSVVTDGSLIACSFETLTQMAEIVGVSSTADSKQVIITNIRKVCPLLPTARDKTLDEIVDGFNSYLVQSQSFANIFECLKGPIGSYIPRDLNCVTDVFKTPEDESTAEDYEKEVYLIDNVSNLKKRVRNHFLLEDNKPSKKMLAMKVFTEEKKNSLISFFSETTASLLKREIELNAKLDDLKAKIDAQNIMIEAQQEQINNQTAKIDAQQNQINELNSKIDTQQHVVCRTQ